MKTHAAVTVLGVRGSFPAAGREFLGYGGNTSCFLADFMGETVLLDAGSGLAALGTATPLPEGRKRFHLLLSHLHIDHLMGLFSFSPLYDPEAELILYGRAGEDGSLRSRLETLLGPPYWPVGFHDFAARIQVRELTSGESLALGRDLTLSTMAGNHPGGSLLYRLEGGGKTLVYALDCEMTGDTPAALAAFARDADLLVWDAAFAPKELIRGWGHSTWEEGIALGRRARAKRVLMTHYSQSYTDRFLAEQETLAGTDSCLFAREGMVIEL